MIPKKIHYCWFGGKELPEDAKKCIESWKKFCPEFEITEWNESNYDVNKFRRMAEAYRCKKWAFVTDCARMDIINENGGIYFDTDVELIRPIDEELLNNKMFMGLGKVDPSEKSPVVRSVQSGLGFGAEKGHPILSAIMEEYKDKPFILEDGSFDRTPCPFYEMQVLKRFGIDDKEGDLQRTELITVYPSDRFSPMDYKTGNLEITENTYSIHWFSMSWQTPTERKYKKMEWQLAEKYGYEKAHKIVRRRSFLYRAIRKIFRLKK